MRFLDALRTSLSAVLHALASGLGAVGHAVARVWHGFLNLLPGEWKKPIAALFVTGLAVVPLVYAGNMTWAFRDPSGQLDQITAAVVNEDRGATLTPPGDGDPVDLTVGDDFVDELVDIDEPGAYRFVVEDRATAEAGLADGTYGAMIEIPADFSGEIAKLGDDALGAAPAMITVSTNDSINYVGANFTRSVGSAITSTLRDTVLEKYLDQIYVGFRTVHDGISDAADGAGELADGSATLRDGAGDLHDGSLDLVAGLDELVSGSVTLEDGTATLAGGARSLHGGLVTLDENGQPLRTGAQQLADGTEELDSGAQSLSGGAREVADGTDQLDSTLDRAHEQAQEHGIDAESVRQASDDLVAAVDALEGGLTELGERLDGLGVDADSVADRAEDIDERAEGADDAAQRLAGTTSERADDARTIQEGTASIADDVEALERSADETDEAAGTARDSSQTAAETTDGYTRDLDALAERCADSGAEEALCADLDELAGRSDTVREQSSQAAGDAQTASDRASESAEQTTSVAETADGMRDAGDRIVGFLDELEGTTQTVADGTSAVTDVTGPVATDARSVADGVDEARRDAEAGVATDDEGRSVTDRAQELADDARSLALALPGAYDTLEQGREDVHRLNEGAHGVADGADELAGATGEASSGAGSLADGVDEYTDGVGSARDGSQQLVDGSGALEDGAGDLADGSRSARDGAGQLADGSGDLEDGADELVDGSEELHDGLDDARGDVPVYSDAERDNLSSAAADPVQMDFEREHGLSRFGEGLAPLFLGIGLWVGGMAIFLMMPPFSRRAAAQGAGPVRLLLGGLGPALVLGVVQSLIAVAALSWLVDLDIAHMGLMVGLTILTSFTFVALNHGFGAVLGPVGKFVALVLIALQISGAGGTYPVPTLPGFFQTIHPFLPMSHAVDAFRGAIGGGWVDPTGDLLWLGAWFLFAIALGLLGAFLTRRQVLTEEAEVSATDGGGPDDGDGMDTDVWGTSPDAAGPGGGRAAATA